MIAKPASRPTIMAPATFIARTSNVVITSSPPRYRPVPLGCS